MERSPRLVGGLRRLRGPSLVVAGFLAGPAPRDGVRNQLRVGIVPGVLLRWWKRSRVSAGRPPGADAFPRLLREKKRALRWLRVRASGRGRTFFMEGRFTGFGTDSFIAVAIVRPLLCGTGRIDGGEMVAKTKVKPIDGKRGIAIGEAPGACAEGSRVPVSATPCLFRASSCHRGRLCHIRGRRRPCLRGRRRTGRLGRRTAYRKRPARPRSASAADR